MLFAASAPEEESVPTANDYIVITWNDLGIHCANKDFSNICILPPDNTKSAHIIQVGDQSNMPVVMIPAFPALLSAIQSQEMPNPEVQQIQIKPISGSMHFIYLVSIYNPVSGLLV